MRKLAKEACDGGGVAEGNQPDVSQNLHLIGIVDDTKERWRGAVLRAVCLGVDYDESAYSIQSCSYIEAMNSKRTWLVAV